MLNHVLGQMSFGFESVPTCVTFEEVFFCVFFDVYMHSRHG